jgi:acyl-CoA thioesterase I
MRIRRYCPMAGTLSKKLSTLLLLIAVVVLTAGVIYAHKPTTLSRDETASSPTDSRAASTDSAPAPTSVTFAVLGDSYSEGAGASPGRGWVEHFGEDMCWSLMNLSAEFGTGYTDSGDQATPGFARFNERIGDVVAGQPKVVIVQGGANDADATPEQITAEASKVFGSLRTALGENATIVAIGPVPTPLTDPPSLAPVSAAISAAASQFGVDFIDPVAEDWLSNPTYFSVDQFHPNDQGYAQFASNLEASLRQHGLKPDAACG